MSEFQYLVSFCAVVLVAIVIQIAVYIWDRCIIDEQSDLIDSFKRANKKLVNENRKLDESLWDSEQFVARAHMLFVNYVMQGEDCKQEAGEWVKDFLGDEESEGRDV